MHALMHSVCMHLYVMKVIGLNVYTYDTSQPDSALGLLTQNGDTCRPYMFGAEVIVHEYYNSMRVEDPDLADLFFVPMYPACIYYGSANATSTVMDERLLSDLTVVQNAALLELPYFKRNNGSDHVFVLFFKSLYPGWRQRIPNSIVLTVESEVEFEISSSYFKADHRVGGTSPPYNPATDVIIPSFSDWKYLRWFARGAKPPGEPRKWLASFFGKRWIDVDECFPIRDSVRRVFSGRNDSVIVAVDTVRHYAPLSGVVSVMSDSVFCLIPRGRAAFTTRLYDALWAGCVPVILSDHYVMPFHDLIDPNTFSIKWPVDRIDDSLVQYLLNMPASDIASYRIGAGRARCSYLYPQPISEDLVESCPLGSANAMDLITQSLQHKLT